MKNLSIILFSALLVLAACTKSKEVHPEIGDGNDEIITVGMKDVHVEYTRTDHAELSRVVFHYSLTEVHQFAAAEMTKQETFFELTLNDLLSDTLYDYYYELFYNGGDTSITVQKTFHTQAYDMPEPPEPPTPSDTIPEGAINGLFTINEAGDKVYFSQGNLQYQASTNTWRFAEHQWDFVGTQTPNYLGYVAGTVSGSDNINISPTYNGWIDLFGWGTSGWDSGNTYYHPWDDWEPEPGNEEEYHLHSLYGPPGEHSISGSYANSDWGIYNAIINGGNRSGIWRTLSIEEWIYLFYTRSTNSDARFAIACLNGVNGVVLLPDSWTLGNFNLNNINIGGSDYGDNVISSTEWEVLEQFGVVFLPAAGVRSKWFEDGIVHVYNGNITGDYWSISCSTDYNSEYNYMARILDFSGGWTTPFINANDMLRSSGISVRLVQDAR